MVKSICLSGTLTEVMRLNVLRILSLPLEDVDMNVGRMYRNNVFIEVQKRDSTSGVRVGFLDPLLSELQTIAAGVTDEDRTATLCFTPSIRLCNKYFDKLRQELIKCGAKETIFTRTKHALLSRWHSCTHEDVQQQLRRTFVMGVGDCKALIATLLPPMELILKIFAELLFLDSHPQSKNSGKLSAELEEEVMDLFSCQCSGVQAISLRNEGENQTALVWHFAKTRLIAGTRLVCDFLDKKSSTQWLDVSVIVVISARPRENCHGIIQSAQFAMICRIP